jgi:hypothetical protein
MLCWLITACWALAEPECFVGGSGTKYTAKPCGLLTRMGPCVTGVRTSIQLPEELSAG